MAANPVPSPTESGDGPRIWQGPYRRYGALIRSFGFAGLTSLSNLLVVLVMLIAARVLGREDFGALAYAQSLAIVIMTPVSFGMEQLAVREVSRRTSLGPHYLFNHLIWASVLAATLLALAATGLALFEEDPRLRFVILLTAATWGLRLLAISAQVYFRPLQLFGRESMVALGGQGIYMVLCLLALALMPGLIPFVISIFAARVIAFLVTLSLVGRTVGFSRRFDPRLVRRLQWVAAPIGLSFALSAAYTQMDVLILRSGLGMGFEDIGVYGAALKVYLALFMLPAIVSNVLLPRLSVSSAGTDERRHRRLTLGGGLLLLAISVPMVVIGVILSPWLMETAFGSDYAEGAVVMQILFIAAAISFQVTYARTLFVVIDRQRIMVWITLFGLVVRIVLVWILSEIWGIDGAAIAVLLSEVSVLALCWGYFALRKK